jgi:hypothetical protein
MKNAPVCDSSRVVTGSFDGTARVWDAGTGQTLPTLTGHTKEVTAVALSADGRRVVTTDLTDVRIVWDGDTGERLRGAEVPATLANDGRTPDGRYLFVRDNDRVIRYPLTIDAEELARRRWLTRPDPEWHIERRKELEKAGNAYGAALHRWQEANARGIVAFDSGRLDEAWAHFIHAAVLNPPVPQSPPFRFPAPPPREWTPPPIPRAQP